MASGPTTLTAAKKYLLTEGALLSKVPDRLATQDLLLEAVHHVPSLISQLVPTQIDDVIAIEACVIAVSIDGLTLRMVHPRWRVEEVYHAAVAQTHQAMHWVPDSAKTPSLCLLAASHGCLWAVPADKRTEAVCIKAMSRCSSNSNYVDWSPKMAQSFREAGLGGFIPKGGDWIMQDV